MNPTGTDQTRSAPCPAIMLGITAAWGLCFLAIRLGLQDAPVLWFAALRALIAASEWLLRCFSEQACCLLRGLRTWCEASCRAWLTTAVYSWRDLLTARTPCACHRQRPLPAPLRKQPPACAERVAAPCSSFWLVGANSPAGHAWDQSL